MAELFGRSNIFTTLSLSLSLSQVLTYNSLYIIKIHGSPASRKADAFFIPSEFKF